MKTKLLLVILSIIFCTSCTKTTTTPTPKPSYTVTMDSTESLIVGKWGVEKYVDSTSAILADSTHSAGSPQVKVTPGKSTEYIDFRSTRDDTFHVGTDTKKKDCINMLHGITPVQCAWWYDVNSKVITAGANYELISLSPDKMIIYESRSTNYSGTIRLDKSVRVYLYRL